MSSRVTIKDVAREAGVSISTVSRVMNNSAPVDAAIRVRVIETMHRIGYTPNQVARSLKNSESTLIAYVVSNTADPFFTNISRAIEEVMYLNGFRLINCSTNFSIEREQGILSALLQQRVRGIIINTVGKNDENVAAISRSVPMVLSNRNITVPGFRGDFVDYDNVGGVRKLVEHLIALGHTKIGFISGPRFLTTSTERYTGFCNGMLQCGITVDESYPFVVHSTSTFTLQDGFEAMEQLMSRPERPTAVIAANSEMALGALQYCRSHGVRIPEELSLCCFGDIAHNDLMYVKMTHVHTDFVALGTRIGEMLLERSEDGRSDAPRLYNREARFDTPLIIGESTSVPDMVRK